MAILLMICAGIAVLMGAVLLGCEPPEQSDAGPAEDRGDAQWPAGEPGDGEARGRHQLSKRGAQFARRA